MPGTPPGGPGQCRERRSRPVREWERYRPSMSDIDERVLDALALDWPKLSVLPSGETEEISLASVRELAQYLSVTEPTIRRSVQRLKARDLIEEYQWHDMERGVRRLYIRLKPETPPETLQPAMADLLRLVPGHE
jgi:hypothetical protein